MLVSVIIPCHNSEKYILYTIESVINQTHKNLEIIVIDDGSSDNSINILQNIRDTRIKLLSQPKKGAGAARNLGIKNAKGQYIQFLDSDDILSKTKIETQLHDLKNEKFALSVCKTVHFNNDENYLEKESNAYEDSFLFSTEDSIGFLMNLWGYNDWRRGSMIQTNAWLIPKSLIDKAGLWVEFTSPDDDGEFFSRVISNTKKIIYNTEGINYYRKHKNSQLSNRNSLEKLQGALKTTFLKERNLEKFVDKRILNFVIDRQLFDIVYQSYPLYPQIYTNPKIVDRQLRPYKNFYQNPILRVVNKLLNWKTVRYIQYLKNK